jgi:acylphosphatase
MIRQKFVFAVASLAMIGVATHSNQGMPFENSTFAEQTIASENQAESDNTKTVSKHIIFSGKVQGVGFRNKARSVAASRQLTGFVRNLANGTVEMLVQGKAQAVDDCLKDIKQFFKENIKEIQIDEVEYESKYTNFRVLF